MARKVKNLMLGGFADEDDDYEMYGEEEFADAEPEPARGVRRAERAGAEYARAGRQPMIERESSKIVSFNSGNAEQTQVLIQKPSDMEQAAAVSDHFKLGSIIVVSLEEVDKPLAQRIADFLGGAVYVQNGEIERISDDIFVMAPAHVKITSEFKRELKSEFKFGSMFSRTHAGHYKTV
ncbi:MAG: cell division protein SepF [Firmicutes bacterium]|nr:cell division protein SepF [Bacillota bacterium]